MPDISYAPQCGNPAHVPVMQPLICGCETDGGGGDEFAVTFNGMAVTFDADDVIYSPDL